MNTPIDKALGAGNCGRVIDRGEEAAWGRQLRQARTKAARLRTETSYKAGLARRVSQSSRSRTQTARLVNDELVQRKFMLLSGETCIVCVRTVVTPASKACLKPWNESAKANSGGAGVSRGRSSDPRIPIETRRTER